MEIFKLLSTNEIVAQVITFLLFFFVLRALLWKRFLGILDQRKEKIVSEFQAAEKARQTAQELKNDYAQKLKTVEDAAKARFQEIMLEAQKMSEKIKKEAQIQAQRIIDDGHNLVSYEISQGKEKLKKEIIDLVLETTEHVIEEKLTFEEDRKIVENFIDHIDKIS